MSVVDWLRAVHGPCPHFVRVAARTKSASCRFVRPWPPYGLFRVAILVNGLIASDVRALETNPYPPGSVIWNRERIALRLVFLVLQHVRIDIAAVEGLWKIVVDNIHADSGNSLDSPLLSIAEPEVYEKRFRWLGQAVVDQWNIQHVAVID